MNYIDRIKTLSPHISYTDNNGYRNNLRQIFNMDITKRSFYGEEKYELPPDEELDNESLDELMFDDDAITKGMDQILINTKSEPVFIELYELAAARMFSTEISIGQAVLCSYDTLHLYFYCIWHYLNYGLENMLSTIQYKILKEYFH